MNTVIIWLVRQLAAYAISCLAKKLGHTEAAGHVMDMLENAKPLPPDPLPSPKASREPKAPWLHTGDSIADASE